MPASMSNSTMTNTVFEYNVKELTISNATIDRCNFKGEINKASISGSLTKCQFEKLTQNIVIKGPIEDMTVQVDLTPSSAQYAQDRDIPSKLISIGTLSIDNVTVPRLIEIPHKECFINIINPGNKVAFIVQLSTDDTNPRGVILMFYPGATTGSTLQEMIPKGYALCDGTNGTPDLRGKFVRAAEDLSDVGEHTNNDLVSNEGDTRERYIQIHDYNLPPHIHYFNEINIDETSHVSSQTGQASTSYHYYEVSSSSENVNEGEGSSVYSGDSVSSQYRSGSDSHQHSINIDVPIQFSFTPTQKEDEFENTKINVEPNNYALIFIMKL